MTVAEIISKLEGLDLADWMQVRAWLDEHDENSEALDAAIARGVAELDQGLGRIVTREEMMAKVEARAGRSR